MLYSSLMKYDEMFCLFRACRCFVAVAVLLSFKLITSWSYLIGTVDVKAIILHIQLGSRGHLSKAPSHLDCQSPSIRFACSKERLQSPLLQPACSRTQTPPKPRRTAWLRPWAAASRSWKLARRPNDPLACQFPATLCLGSFDDVDLSS